MIEEQAKDILANDPSIPQLTPPTPAPEPPKPAEPEPPEEEFELNGVKWETPSGVKSADDRKNWRTYKQQVKEEVTRLRSEMEALKKAPPTTVDVKPYEEKLAAYEKQRAEMEEQLGRYGLEHTPEFKRHYVESKQAAIADTKELFAADANLANKVEAILSMPPELRRSQLAALSEDLPAFQVSYLTSAERELSKIDREKANAIKDWRTQMEFKTKAEQQRAEHEKSAAMRMYDQIVNDFKKDNPAFKQSDPETAALIAAREQQARSLFTGELDAKDRARLAIEAAALPVVAKQASALMKEVEELKAALEKARAKSPAIAGGEATSTGISDAELAGKSFGEQIEALARRQGLMR